MHKDIPLVDVRSPGEFAKGHIPGAVNLPLFDNQERATVGTLYKQSGRESAFLEGLSLVGPKLRGFVEQARHLGTTQELMVHCWRGGMRSGSMAWLWETAGFEVSTLIGGYKAYRRWVQDSLTKPWPLIVLGGKTGSGKTDLLHALQAAGEQIIDLEGLANHKGSAFGGIHESPQPSTEHFENRLHHALSQLDLSRRIWIEDESIMIGKVAIPMPFFEQMQLAQSLIVEVPLSTRIDHLVAVYASANDEILKEAILRIEKRLGKTRCQSAIQAIDQGQYDQAAEICLYYYDKAYNRALEQKSLALVSDLTLSNVEPTQAAQLLIQRADALIPHT